MSAFDERNRERFVPETNSWDLFVPGRLCLFGEHSDWAGEYRARHPQIAAGRCLVAGTDQGLRASATRVEEVLEISSELMGAERIGPERIAIDEASLAQAAAGTGFFSYAAATLAELRLRHDVGGMRLVVRSDLPVRKGLSSSAAICVLVARAASRLYALDLSIAQEMDIGYAGERRTGSECGRMDQICAFGRGPVAMDIDGSTPRFEPVRCGGIFHLLIVDLCRGKDTRKILTDLNACFPATPGAVAAGVRDALGQRNREILAEACDHLADGNGEGLGRLMTRAQQIFDEQIAPACSELAAPRMHEVLASDAVSELAWGGKGVGSQGDGCAQVVARSGTDREHLARRLEREFDVRCLNLTLGGDR